MTTYTIQSVHTAQDIRDFHQLPYTLYASTEVWIPPITAEVEKVFSPKDNAAAFEGGKVVRWNVYDSEQKIVGRIAAFTNDKYTNKGDTQPTGGIGFFECIHQQEVAFMLFDTAKAWLETQGMEAMDGPINFGGRDKWWGLLVDGYQYAPTYTMNYHLPYYKDFFVAYGFEVFYEQYCYSAEARQTLTKSHWEYYEKWANDPDITARPVERFRLKKYANDFAKVYNAAWASHEGDKTISPEEALKIFKKMRLVMDTRIAYFVYHKDEPIACWLNLPELNQYMKHLKGKWNWWAQLKLIFLILFGRPKYFVGIVFGIVPQWQGKGIDRYMVIRTTHKNPSYPKYYQEMFMQWIGDFNPKMIIMVIRIGGKKIKTFHTMRYLFDRNKKFERHPMVNL